MASIYNWESFIRIHGGEAGARDVFEKAMDELLRAENPDKEVHIVKAVQGDGGIDVYIHQEGGIDIYQCKFFMGSMNSSRWSQIKESFTKAMEPKGVKVLRWVLCMPREMQKEDIAKWDQFLKDRSSYDVEISLIDGNEIIARMRKCDREKGTDLIERYFVVKESFNSPKSSNDKPEQKEKNKIILRNKTGILTIVVIVFICAIVGYFIIIPTIIPDKKSISAGYETGESNTAVTDVVNSIVRVFLVYKDEFGSKHIISTSTGFFINDLNVVTSSHALQLQYDEIESIIEYYGIDQKTLMNRLSIEIGIVEDVCIRALVTTKSEKYDFAVLELESKVFDYNCLPLRSSKNMNLTEECFGIGFNIYEDAYGDSGIYSRDNAIVTNGSINQITTLDGITYYKCSSSLIGVGEGGALVDVNGNVIGLFQLVFNDGNNSYLLAEVTDYLIETLNILGIQYQNNSY